MKIINASYEILTDLSPDAVTQSLKHIEAVARTCYKSEHLTTDDDTSAKNLIRSLISRGHEAMIEHSTLSVKFICDRGISHEIVRHRLASYGQESSRYCNYSQNKFGNEITVIKPFFFKTYDEAYREWYRACAQAEESYIYLLSIGITPEQARTVLPTSLKTELNMTANYREWRNFLKLRTDKAAHPQIRELAIPLLKELQEKIPLIFDDITPN